MPNKPKAENNGASNAVRIARRITTFGIEGSEFADVEVVARSDVSIGQYLDIKAMVADEDGILRLAKLFGDELLVSWNIADDKGQPFPPDGNGMLGLPMHISMRIVRGWLEAVAEVPPPLDTQSNVGETLGALSTTKAIR